MLKILLLSSGLFFVWSCSEAPAQPQLLWSAGVEGGDLKEWDVGRGGGKFNTNQADAVASRDYAHSGEWSAKLTISGTSMSATRLYRWKEAQEHREAYYSAWYFVPQRYTVNPGGWTNWFFFKSRMRTRFWINEPFFILALGNKQPSGAMHLGLAWWQSELEGPQPGQWGRREWLSSVEIPVGRWFHLEVRLVCAGDFSGAIQVWQDGVELFNLEGVRTRHVNGDCRWGISNYGENISPAPVVIYVDDAVISTTRRFTGIAATAESRSGPGRE